LQIVHRELINDYWYLYTTEAIWLYTLRYNIIIFYRFCWSPWHSVHNSLPTVRKCSNRAWSPL